MERGFNEPVVMKINVDLMRVSCVMTQMLEAASIAASFKSQR